MKYDISKNRKDNSDGDEEFDYLAEMEQQLGQKNKKAPLDDDSDSDYNDEESGRNAKQPKSRKPLSSKVNTKDFQIAEEDYQETQTVQQLFSEEADLVKQMIKKIMYAEGDLLTLRDECAQYLKDALQ